MTVFPLVVTMLMQAATPAPAATPAAADVPEPNAAAMSMAEIKQFNRTVAADHPHRITCRPIAVTGSLVKRGRVCRTIAQWQSLEADGNAQARAIVEHSATRMGGQ